MNRSMNGIVGGFAQAASELKVHKRTAANIKEQLLIIARSHGNADSDARSLLLNHAMNPIQELHVLSQLSPLQNYLRQGEISDLLDSLLEVCWRYVQAGDDGFLREDVETQREIFRSDQEADRISIRRLLRDCLRKNDIQLQISRLTPEETSALISAIKLELHSISHQDPNCQASRLFREFLNRLGAESVEERRVKPIPDLTRKIVKISMQPIAWGAICAIWKAELYGKCVAVYSPRFPIAVAVGYKPQRDEERVVKDASVWASFDHPHVLPMIGICREFDGQGLALVSPWMEDENVDSFLRTNPGADRLRLITETASGLAYLHSLSPPYIHGLLSGSAIMINKEKQVLIGGFASATFEKGFTVALRWLAPELVAQSYGVLTTASDVYSFAMAALTIMTGKIPFSGIRSSATVIQKLRNGERPARPNRKLVHHGLDDRLWALICLCWAQNPNSRPLMTHVLQELEKMRELSVLNVKDLTELITLRDGSSTDIQACGAFGDIRVGIMKDVGPVALKTLNIRGKTQPVLRHTKRFLREASIWNDLKHPNVLPFLGTADPPWISTCLVSPWMENGSLIEFLRRCPNQPVLHIARGIARGLGYLHAHTPNAVIHGDLRAANVLISDTGEPLLCDFGLAVILEDLAQMPISSLLQEAGNPRWMAPELFVGEQQVSTASDIWALGMVILEMTSLDIPYCELKSSAQVIVAVHKGSLPFRPRGEDAIRRGLNDGLWGLMLDCWAQKPIDRPQVADILDVLELLLASP